MMSDRRSVVLLCVAALCLAAPARAGELEIGAKGPDFSLPGVDGKTYSLQTADAKVVIVIFTCNHCPVAKAYQDRIIQIQKDYADKGVQIVAINANDATKYEGDSFENMKKRAKEKNFNFPYLQDEPQETARAYGAKVTPHVFLLDQKRVLKYRGRIDDNWQKPGQVKARDLRAAVAAVLAQKPVPNPVTKQVGCGIKWKK